MSVCACSWKKTHACLSVKIRLHVRVQQVSADMDAARVKEEASKAEGADGATDLKLRYARQLHKLNSMADRKVGSGARAAACTRAAVCSRWLSVCIPFGIRSRDGGTRVAARTCRGKAR